MKKIRICILSTNRADYGLLYYLLRQLEINKTYESHLIVTGQHLKKKYGLTVNYIKRDKLKIAKTIDILSSENTNHNIIKSMAKLQIELSKFYQENKTDLIIILGDRYEIMPAAISAMIHKIPIAHIGGGDVTKGAYDDTIRDCLSRMSSIDFVTNNEAKKRLIKLGKNKKLIFNVGSPGLEYIKNSHLLSKDKLATELNIKFSERVFLITIHPATLEIVAVKDYFNSLISAIKKYRVDTDFIFTSPNSDSDSDELIKLIERYVKREKNTYLYKSLGQINYISMLKISDLIIGNSSSGLYEAPSLSTPTVNIGSRQKGRLKAKSVFDCMPTSQSISNAISKALKYGKKKTKNPYYAGNTSELILKQINKIKDFKRLAYQK